MKQDIQIDNSPLMTEDAKHELYLYSLKKMASENAEKQRISLTNLYGTKAFFFQANEHMHQYRELQYAIIRMDLCSFKTVNEFCGRAEGDKILKYISDCFREYENTYTVVGHLRADIFVMCIPFEERQELVDIVTGLKEKIIQYPLECKVFPSFGICIAKNNMDASLMCDYADIAITKIKGKVFTYYSFYDEKMRNELLYERKIEIEIEDALENEDLQIYVQPKVDMHTGNIIGGEALVRWIHPVEGLIYPDQFISVLEKSGHIVKVDAYVWENVLIRLQEMQRKGMQLVPISLNVSGVHVYQKDFVELLETLIDTYEISPQYIPLEVTESVFTEEQVQFYEKVKYLQSKGFQFVMDDFGSGYSSLNMLKEEPIDEVKIDRMFLIDMEQNPKSQVVVRNVIQMLNELGMNMIAEGVETERQAQMLQEYGCDKAQGYLYYKPMPIDDFEQLLIQTQNK